MAKIGSNRDLTNASLMATLATDCWVDWGLILQNFLLDA